MPEFKMFAVSSSLIKEIGYDEAEATLAVQFKKGDTYLYKGVPRETYDSFRAAESIGEFFLKNIKPVYCGVKA